MHISLYVSAFEFIIDVRLVTILVGNWTNKYMYMDKIMQMVLFMIS